MVATAAVAGALSQGMKTLDQMGILEKVRNKLVNNPDRAAGKLARVLAELRQTFQIVEDTLVGFNSLTFDSPEARDDALKFLNRARGESLTQAMMEAKAHCSNIGEVYDRFLRGWFSKVLDRQEQNQINDLFNTLRVSDTAWIDMLEFVAHELQKTSNELLDYTDKQNYDGARAAQQSVVKNFREHQTQLGNKLLELQKLTQDFSAITTAMAY